MREIMEREKVKILIEWQIDVKFREKKRNRREKAKR
jgi:hypothetical protein